MSENNYKYIELPEPELYDLEKDPHELDNIIEDEKEKAEAMQTKLLAYVKNKRPELEGLLNTGAKPKEKIGLMKFHILPRIPLARINIDSAIKHYEGLVSKDPGNKLFKYTLVRIYIAAGKLDLAKEKLLRMLEQDPDENRAWGMLAMVYDRRGETDKAIECYKRTLAINPDTPFALNNLAWHYAGRGKNLDEALELAQKAIALSPGNANFLDTLAEVYLKRGEKEKAIETFKKALNLDPDSKVLQDKLKSLEEKPETKKDISQ